jgi:hypothetical protein
MPHGVNHPSKTGKGASEGIMAGKRGKLRKRPYSKSTAKA